LSELDAIASGSGKWSKPGVPHKGWKNVGEVDLREEDRDAELEVCEMCEAREIRYVHIMEHPKYPSELRCGVVCAGKLAEDYEGAQLREKRMRGRATRRENFHKRKGWKVAKNGNPYIVVEGYHIAIAQRNGGRAWAVGVKLDGAIKHIWGEKIYHSVEAAKSGAFGALEYAREEWPPK
jgi:hypothetical protein